ncbi:hypothetical protein Dimus_016342, partial [Dionaea muscipula]
MAMRPAPLFVQQGWRAAELHIQRAGGASCSDQLLFSMRRAARPVNLVGSKRRPSSASGEQRALAILSSSRTLIEQPCTLPCKVVI